MPTKPNLTTHFGIRIEAKDLKKIQAYAEELGLQPSGLVRMWIKEKLREIKQGK
jgi:antitoxin component of RelBE/YafQ-DinJ toxin-antitoxin module